MRSKTLTVTLAVVLLIGLAGYFLFGDYFDNSKKSAKEYSNIPDIKATYKVADESKAAMDKLRNAVKPAAIISRVTGVRSIGIAFDGITNESDMTKILNSIDEHQLKTAFFMGNLQTVETPQVVVDILRRGQQVGGYIGANQLQSNQLTTTKLVENICRNQKIISSYTGKQPLMLKTANGVYTADMLKISAACGINSVVKPTVIVSPAVLQTQKEAEIFVRSLKPGSIIGIRLNIEEPITPARRTEEMRAEMEKKPGLKQDAEAMTNNLDMVLAVQNLAKALNSEKIVTVPLVSEQKPVLVYADVLDKVITKLDEVFSTKIAYAEERKMAEELKMIHTTEQAVAFTFGDLGDPAVVDKVLQKLKEIKAQGTFFVAEIEMLRQSNTVRQIVAAGHEMGIVIRPKDDASVQETKELIIHSQQILSTRFGVQTNLIKQPWGKITDNTKQAVAELGCTLVGQSINLIQSAHQDYSTATQVMQAVFKPYMNSLRRGEIIYFRMNFYKNKDLIVDLMESVKKDKVDSVAYNKSFDNIYNNQYNDSQYIVKPVGAILNNKKYTYDYPINLVNVPEHLRDDTYDQGVNEKNLVPELAKRYIGNSTVDKGDRILGFSNTDLRRFDTQGLINTDDNVIFISFDDWSTDVSINRILYVLRKHNVKATFFIITKNVPENINLLRSIAVEGHDISSHSNEHKAMVYRDKNNRVVTQPRTKEQAIEDYKTAYIRLRDIVGDVQVDGRYVLNRDFRPPTMAFSREGVEALFAAGTGYIINGSYSSHDYMAKDIADLVSGMREWLYNADGSLIKGSVLIMHMTDPSGCTAPALDILLTANELKDDSDPSKFYVGLMSDYLRDGYKQIDYKALPKQPVNR